jgi:hypothetical protein
MSSHIHSLRFFKEQLKHRLTIMPTSVQSNFRFDQCGLCGLRASMSGEYSRLGAALDGHLTFHPVRAARPRRSANLRIARRRNLPLLLVLPLATLVLGTAPARNQPADKVLARVGNKEIRVKEFTQRSELTIRANQFKDKNTALNNLICEKILALEAGRNAALLQDPSFQGMLKGIKEQRMRDKLYEAVAANKVKIDTGEMKSAFRASMREYEVEFCTIRTKVLAEKIRAVLDSVPELSGELFKEVEETLGTRPVHTVTYKDPDDEVIHEALFTSLLDTGAVVGPLRMSSGEYIIMKVLHGVDRPLISGFDQQVRWNEVKEKLRQAKANKMWTAFQVNTMKGKKIEFNREAFTVLADLALQRYLQNSEKDSSNNRLTEITVSDNEVNLSVPFFTIDKRVWSVDDFRRELLSHPLVYRTKDLNKDNFKEEFKLAIVDMLRDHYVTQEAYKRSLDRSKDITREMEMWEDSFLATDQEKSIVSSAVRQGVIQENDQLGKLKYWKSYLHGLQKKYGGSVRINRDEFSKIRLANIDLVVIRPGVPYPMPVPQFPTFVASGNLDYAAPQK